MKTPVKVALAVVLFIAIAGIGGALYLYNLKPKDLKSVNPDYTLTSTALQKAFEENETSATAKYVNKIIEVSGEIISIKEGEQRFVNVSLKTGNDLSAVLCTFPHGNDLIDLKSGTSVTVRGSCSGFLMDVLLKNCVLVESKK
jgi:hypothetical protein